MEVASAVLGIEEEKLAEICYKNTLNFFNLKDDLEKEEEKKEWL